MPELELPETAGGRIQTVSAGSTDAALDKAYQRYLADTRAQGAQAVPMSAAEFERYSLDSNWLSGLRSVVKTVVQTCRLMVGVHDYEYYLEHMRTLHPGVAPMDRKTFYRYCIDVRYPGAGNAGSRCPC